MDNTGGTMWLENKLGEENWVPPQINKILRVENIESVVASFETLNAGIQIQILLSMLHLDRSKMDEMDTHFEKIINMALKNADHWVRIIAEILKFYPRKFQFHKYISSVDSRLSSIINDLVEAANESPDSRMLPLECRIVSKELLKLISDAPERKVEKHFTLKRKPKSAALRQELLQRSQDYASQIQKQSSRSRITSSSSKYMDKEDGAHQFVSISSGKRQNSMRSTNQKTSRSGGTKMLDIGEAPPTIKQKKTKKSKKEKSSAEGEGASTDSDSEAKNAVFLERRDSQSSISSGPFSPTHSTPGGTPGVGPIFQVSEENRLKKRRRDSGRLNSTNSESSSVSPYAQRRTPGQISTPPQQPFTSPQTMQQHVPAATQGFMPQGGIYGDGQIYQEDLPHPQSQQHQQHQMQQAQAQQAGYAAGETMTLTMETTQQHPYGQTQQTIYGDQQQQEFTPSAPQATAQTLQLNQEQMAELQDIFSRAQNISQDDKFLIIRFMSGNFERPENIPSIHRIPLYSELHQQAQQFGDQQQVTQFQVDVYYELNYETGESKKFFHRSN